MAKKEKANARIAEKGGGAGRLVQYAEVESLAALCAFAERGPKASLPALRSVAFRGGRAEATDLVVGASMPFAGLDGMTVPAAVLGAVVGTKSDVRMSAAGESVAVEAGGFRARVPVLAEDSFPGLPKAPPEKAWLPLGDAPWAAALSVAFAVAREMEPGVNGVLLKGGRAFACTGVWLAAAPLPDGAAAAGLLPLRLMNAVTGAFPGSAPEAAAWGEESVWLRFPGGAVCWCRLPAAEPPDVVGLADDVFAKVKAWPSAAWDIAAGLAALGRVAGFADAKVTLKAEGAGLVIRASGPLGDAEEAVAAEVSGGGFDADFGTRYLADAFRLFGRAAVGSDPGRAVFSADGGLRLLLMGMSRA